MKRKTLCFIMLFIALWFLLTVSSYAGTQKWNSLDYDVTLNADGSMDVVETWNIEISETNTLFKDFNTVKTNYEDITNVQVSRVTDGEEYFLEQIYEEQYHVDSGCFYALPIQGSKFEIAWNVGLDYSSDTRIYKLYYTVENVVKVYNDCSEFYWMFLGEENSISGKNITGTVTLPESVSDIEKIRVWAHGDLSGTIERTSNDTVKFSLPSLSKNSMLEIRVVTEENIFGYCTNRYSSNELNNIISEETKWANEANIKRVIAKFKFYLMILFYTLIILLFIYRIKKIKKNGKKAIEKFTYSGEEIEYFRDIPDEKNATPARAAYIMNYENKGRYYMQIDTSKIFAGTILDLSLKGLIEFEPTDNEEVKIFLTEKQDVSLTEDEQLVYDLIVKIIGEKPSITTEELTKYSRKHYEFIYTSLNKIENTIEKFEKDSGIIDEEKLKIQRKWGNSSTINIIFTIFLFVFSSAMIMGGIFTAILFTLLLIGQIFCISAHSKNIEKLGKFSEKGTLYKKQWKGLKKYMEDYSLLKEKQVPDIVLWEKFLVYATTFGISKKVIEQLKVVHPEMFMERNDYSERYARYTYWQMISSNNYGTDYFSDFSKSLERVYDSARSAYSDAHSSSSSSSGGGGGFSSGGGGRWWRRRLWRSLKAIKEKNK